MRRRTRLALLGYVASGLLVPMAGVAQTGITRQAPPTDTGMADQAGGALDVAPRLAEPPPAAAPPSASAPSTPADTAGSAPPDKSGGDGADATATAGAAAAALPYVGVAVQFIESYDTPGREVRGLEVVSVDPGSPAEHAGLRGQGQLTKLGASGATAGALMAPLDLIIMPLLKRAGDLGQDGDLIIAIDDNRVESESDLKNALAGLKPGDVIYLTLVRQYQGGTHETLKLPVRLAPPRMSENADRLQAPA